ncbi:MAG: LPS translocon maturation chaperone LptM [Gammaproteobacteria bacterium]
MLNRRDLILYAICAGTLAGCGQIGPLYLPKQPAVPHAITYATPAVGTISAPAASSLPPTVKAAPSQQTPPPRKTH